MAKQTFTAGQVLTAAEMNSLQENDYNWTVTTKTASYTLAAGDEGTRIVMNNAGATTITVDDAVFAAGDVVWIHNIGAGTCTVTAGTATVNTAASLDLAQWEGGSLYFTSASSAIFFRGPAAGVSYGVATGGDSSATITVGGESYTLLTFLSSGTLTVGTAGVFDVLVVGGGGGGGQSSLTVGGGGAGGYREFEKIYFDTNQTVTIGAGGAVNGRRGSSSVCGDVFCAGGGGGGRVNLEGDNGASGGGMGYASGSAYGRGDGVTGNDGGLGVPGDGGGGGGGAGSAGSANSGASGGAGGTGADASTFRGESAGTTYYAAGGSGSYTDARNGTNGGANTGGGGGGSDGGSAGSGGSGIVLVRFKN